LDWPHPCFCPALPFSTASQSPSFFSFLPLSLPPPVRVLFLVRAACYRVIFHSAAVPFFFSPRLFPHTPTSLLLSSSPHSPTDHVGRFQPFFSFSILLPLFPLSSTFLPQVLKPGEVPWILFSLVLSVFPIRQSRLSFSHCFFFFFPGSLR